MRLKKIGKIPPRFQLLSKHTKAVNTTIVDHNMNYRNWKRLTDNITTEYRQEIRQLQVPYT